MKDGDTVMSMTTHEKEDYYLNIITQAYFALDGSRSPSNTKRQQAEELQRCYELLASVVFCEENKKAHWVADTSHIGA